MRKYLDEEDSIKKAIEECIRKGILAEYLQRKGSEVRNMLVAEYSYEEDIQVKQEEARREGIEQGIERGEDRVSKLIRILIAKGQYDELEKISENREYRGKLLEKYGI